MPGTTTGRKGVIEAAAALAALLLAAASATAASDLPDSFERITAGAFLPGASALHGDELVWASPLFSGGVDILKTDLSSKETTTLTSVLVPSSGSLSVKSVAYDGRWVTWLDNRFGNFDVFALDTSSGTLRRLTSTPQDEQDLTAAGGRAAWILENKLRAADLEANRPWSPSAAGTQDGDPCLSDSFLAWTRLDRDGNAALIALDLESNQTLVVASQFSYGQLGARCDGTRVAWETTQYYDATTGELKSLRMVRWSDLPPGGPPHNVTRLDQRYGSLLAFSAGRLAWLDVAGQALVLKVHDGATNQTVDLEEVTFAGLSEKAVVVARPGAAGEWVFYAQRWDGAGAGAKGIPLPFTGLALALFAAAGLRARARP